MKIFVLPQTRVIGVEKDKMGTKVLFQRGGGEKFVRVEEVIIAGSRKANLDLSLESAKIDHTDDEITVDDSLQTTAKNIFACGSVASAKNTAEAILQGKIAANNIINPRRKISFETSSVRTVNSWPEIASIGLTEDDCVRRDLKFKTAISTAGSVARSATDNFSEGFLKIISDKKGKILGASAVMPEAHSIINQISMAMHLSSNINDLKNINSSYLSWAEIIKSCANKIKDH